MKKYFYLDGTNYLGPFTIDELKKKGITRETMIWCQGLDEWKKAGVIQDLNDLFALIPPPVGKKADFTHKTQTQIGSNSVVDVLVFLSILYWLVLLVIQSVLQENAGGWYESPLKYFLIGGNVIFSIVPLAFALSIKSKSLRVLALVLGGILSAFMLYNNVRWLIYELK